jgi:hypothetical protein
MVEFFIGVTLLLGVFVVKKIYHHYLQSNPRAINDPLKGIYFDKDKSPLPMWLQLPKWIAICLLIGSGVSFAKPYLRVAMTLFLSLI